MEKSDVRYNAYIDILKEELVPAMGCTEPIALAYAAAMARRVLGQVPEKVVIGASGSIIKNVKSVIVPNTDHLKGISAAAAAGIIAGDPDKELEVIAQVTPEQIAGMKAFLEQAEIEVEHVDNGITFDIIVTLYKGESYAKVRIANYHTNIVLIEKDGKILEETEGLISLFIYAPMEARVKEIMRRYETDEKEAEYLIKQADKIRKNYYNFYAKKTWADKASYDMLIDSSRISEKELAAMLRALLTARGVELETDGSDQ